MLFESAVDADFLISNRFTNMGQTKQQKEVIVKDLAEKLKNSKAVVFSDYKGLKVKDMTILRRELRAEGVDLSVVKKTLINIALKDAGIEMDISALEGQIAIAVSEKDEVRSEDVV